MAQKSCLGVHYSSQAITAVLVERQGTENRAVADWRLPISPAEGQPAEKTPFERLAEEVFTRAGSKPVTVLSLGGTFYQTLHHHSEFDDPEIIGKTLRFDVEEDFAADTESQAICFQVVESADPGSHLMVHMVQRDLLSPVFSQMEQAGLDALIAEPDLVVWQQYLRSQSRMPADQTAVYIAWSEGIFYLLVLGGNQQFILGRSSLCTATDQMASLVSAEISRSIALLAEAQRPFAIYYHEEGLQQVIGAVSRQTGLAAHSLADPDVNRAFALGAASHWLAGPPFVDFRSDGMVPHTVAAEKDKALVCLSGAVVCLFLVLMLVTSLFSLKYEKMIAQADQTVADSWRQIYPGKKMVRKSFYVREIKTELDRLQKKQQGQGGQVSKDSASHALLLILERLVALPKDFDLMIESLRVNADSSSLSGSVPDLEAMKEMVKVIDSPESPLEIINWNFMNAGAGSQKGAGTRRTFNIPLQVKKARVAEKERNTNVDL